MPKIPATFFLFWHAVVSAVTTINNGQRVQKDVWHQGITRFDTIITHLPVNKFPHESIFSKKHANPWKFRGNYDSGIAVSMRVLSSPANRELGRLPKISCAFPTQQVPRRLLSFTISTHEHKRGTTNASRLTRRRQKVSSVPFAGSSSSCANITRCYAVVRDAKNRQ
jgi:hypothetical protein